MGAFSATPMELGPISSGLVRTVVSLSEIPSSGRMGFPGGAAGGVAGAAAGGAGADSGAGTAGTGGEAGTTTGLPALRNAIYAATGVPLRRMPVDRALLAKKA